MHAILRAAPLLILAAAAAAGDFFGSPERAPAWLSSAGIRRDGERWVYRGAHALTAEQLAKLEPFFASLNDSDVESRLRAELLGYLERSGGSPGRSGWFERGKDGELALNAEGRQAVPGILLGDPFLGLSTATAASPEPARVEGPSTGTLSGRGLDDFLGIRTRERLEFARDAFKRGAAE